MRRSDLVFFTSGAAALVYETVWIRLLGRALGGDAVGLAVVLAAFMGGMGLGAALFAGAARRSRSPHRLYAALLGGLAIWALLSPWMLERAGPVAGGAARLLVAFGVLAPPTLAMGATFPLMARLSIARREETGRKTSAFYGANTLGAAAGALLGPLVLMPLLGLRGAIACAAGLDLAAGLLALSWLRAPTAEENSADPDRQGAGPGPNPSPTDRLLVGAALLGFSGLALEVVLARVLLAVTGASVYAHAIVLGVFLTGIGLGSRQLAGARPGTRLEPSARLFGLLALAVPASTLLGLLLVGLQLGGADLLGQAVNLMPRDTGVARLWATHALLASLALLLPALCLGAALPAAAAGLVARHPHAPREALLGRLYAANTLGALLGSLGAAFVLLPELGPRLGLLAALVPALAAGILVPEVSARVRLVALGAAAALALAHAPRATPGPTEVLALAHGPFSSARADETPESDGRRTRSLRVDGKVVATTAPVDLRLQRLLGAVPGLLHGEVRSALVIGLGTGMTAGSLLALPSLERLVVVEISSAVVEVSRRFDPWTLGLFEDPRVEHVLGDGGHHLARTGERFDLITSDPIHPWTRGSSDLYALEHFERMAAHLAPGGIASQWLPLYQLSSADLATVIATWCAAFPHTAAWLTAYDLALIGAHVPLPAPGALAERAFSPRMARILAEAGVHSGAELAALQVADEGDLEALSAGTPPMRLDRPVLEFRAPLSFLRGYSVEILAWAGRAEFVERLPPAIRPRAREVRGALARFLEALPRGYSEAARRYGAELLALPPLTGS